MSLASSLIVSDDNFTFLKYRCIVYDSRNSMCLLLKEKQSVKRKTKIMQTVNKEFN